MIMHSVKAQQMAPADSHINLFFYNTEKRAQSPKRHELNQVQIKHPSIIQYNAQHSTNTTPSNPSKSAPSQ